ncbi:MAG: hypothetical protein MUP66_00245 [Candidatus Nanohaloarchaeota archaeon QJJ-5]|nr:hypothetical protein [Candidatus Nanohaloarchaeota archaeon QJJ-5]
MAKSVIQKDWYEIIAPDVFDNEKVAETPADKEQKLHDRRVKVNLQDLMPSSDKYYMDVYLQVKDVEGNKAKAVLAGHDTSKEYISKMVRRQTDRIDQVVDVETSDGREVRVKLIATTINKTTSAAKTEIRKQMEEIVTEQAQDRDFQTFMQDMFQNELQSELNDACKKIYPLKTVEFRKTEVTPN